MRFKSISDMFSIISELAFIYNCLGLIFLMESNTPLSCQKYIVHLFCPGQWIIKVKVLETATSKDIHKFLKDKSVRFLYNGILLDKHHTFKFYGIKNSDIIVVIPSEIDIYTLPQNYREFANNEDLFKDRVLAIVDSNMSNELIRLRDLQLNKFKTRPNAYRKLISAYEEQNIQEEMPLVPQNVNIPFSSKKPTAAPLPAFWATGSTIKPQPNSYNPFLPNPVKSEQIPIRD